MINQQRVQRIKNLIYTIIVLLFILPAIISIVLFLRVRTMEKALYDAIDAQDYMAAEYRAMMAEATDNKASGTGAEVELNGAVIVPETSAVDSVDELPDEDADGSSDEMLQLPQSPDEDVNQPLINKQPGETGNNSVGSVAPLTDNLTTPNPTTGGQVD